jgi:GNAT superfamily N-acetyltransferase
MAVIPDAEPDEASALEDLQRRASLAWEDQREQLEANPGAIEVTPGLVADGQGPVATDSGQRLGFSVTLPGAAGAAELDGLFVEPDAWGRGVGRALVDDAAERAWKRGARRLEVTANPRALGFYEKLGFVGDGFVATWFGPGQRMHRDLGPAVPPDAVQDVNLPTNWSPQSGSGDPLRGPSPRRLWTLTLAELLMLNHNTSMRCGPPGSRTLPAG